MDYQKCAKELLKCMMDDDATAKMLQQNMFEFSRGELGVLIYLIEEKDGAHANEISKKLNVNTSRVAALLNNLSKKGYIVRCIDENDKRKINVYITDEGKHYTYQRKKEVEEYVSQLLSSLGEEDAQHFIRIMKRLYDIE